MIRREFLAGLTGLSALAAAPAISFAQTPMNLGQQWDVIVIGSGLAGLSAALSASENGADRILVIEKLPVLGGHSRLSTGSFLAVSPKRLEPLGIHTSVDAVLEEMMEVGGGIGNKDLARLLLSQSDAAMDWLETARPGLEPGTLCRRRLSLGLRFQNDPRFHRFSLHLQTQPKSTRTRRPLFV